jgi:hypothetical protein
MELRISLWTVILRFHAMKNSTRLTVTPELLTPELLLPDSLPRFTSSLLFYCLPNGGSGALRSCRDEGISQRVFGEFL